MPPKKQKSLKAMLSAPLSTAPPQPCRGLPPPPAPPLELEPPSAAGSPATTPPPTAAGSPATTAAGSPATTPPPTAAGSPATTAAGSPATTAAGSPPPQAADPPPQAPSLVITDGSSASTDPEGPYLSIRCKNNGGEGPVKYRTVVSAKTNRIVRASGKIKVTWSAFTKHPTHDTYTKLVRDIGAIVKTHVPTLAPSWVELEKHHRDILLSHLENMYRIHPDDSLLLNYIDQQGASRYRDWKYRCRRYFKVHGTTVPEDFRHRPEQWNWLLQHEFMPEAKRAISERNQRNRTKNPNPINHHSGSKPLSHMAEDYYIAGKQAPHLHATIHAYEACPNAKEKVDSLKSSLKEIEDAQKNLESEDAQAPPISVEEECEILIKCFGERRGTEVRGMGGGVRRPPKKRGGSWSMETSSKRQELEERAQKAEERAQKADERAERAIEKSDETEKRMEALEQFVRQSLSSTNR